MSSSRETQPPQFDAAPRDNITIFLLDRKMVEANAYEDVAEALSGLVVSPETVRKNAGRIQIVFDGYENDPREIYSIPEVRRFVASLHAVFPYWLHFASKTDPSLFVIMACLLPIGETKLGAAGEVEAAIPTCSLSVLLLRLFGAMNRLYAEHGLTRDENSETTRQVQEYVSTFTATASDIA